jgi:hypothetical protein
MKGNPKAKTPKQYIGALPQPRKSALTTLNALIRKVTKLKPTMMFGMIGYGKFHYRYASGREGDWCAVALASQKQYISIYACMAADGRYIAEGYKSKLPKANIGKSCIRFRRLEDIDMRILTALLKENHRAYKAHMKQNDV